MSIKSRIDKLEENAGTKEAKVVRFHTVFEGEHGDPEGDWLGATVIWGYGMCKTISHAEDESDEQFDQRIETYEQMSWEQAKALEGDAA